MSYLTPITVPDGMYIGTMTGYTLRFEIPGGKEVVATTTIGVRGVNVPHRFVVKDNRIDESSLEALGRATDEDE